MNRVWIVVAVALVLYAWVSRPLAQLTRYAGLIRSGRRVPLPRLGNDEIGTVGICLVANWLVAI